MASVERFLVSVDEATLNDLHDRLIRTRWPHDIANDDWRYGTNLAYIKELVEYWINHYDWTYWEAQINKFAHFKTHIDGVPIHFIREPGKGDNPIPLVLSHGWPWTFWDYSKIIGPLADPASFGGDPADAFEVIVPSLPGFGFSTPLTQAGMNYWRTADLWHTLMKDVLGFERFAAQGGDWGSILTAQLSHKYAASLYGIHVTGVVPTGVFGGERPWDLFGGQLDKLADDERKRVVEIEQRIASHLTVHILDPQTLAYGPHDSPVALLAWLLERRRAWSDCGGDVESRFSKDDLLTTVMLYWVTESFVTSARYYSEAWRNPWQPSHNRVPPFEAPAGISLFAGDQAGLIHPSLSENYNVHFYRERPAGGHFAPFEEPDALIEDIRATFRDLRGQG